MATQQRVQFTLNGELHSVPVDEAAGKTLNEYIRTVAHHTGTKISCAQGGCGACTVSVARRSENGVRSVSSCLTPLAKVHGAAVITVEGLSAQNGILHPVAERLAKFNGSQCGFCTPGMVMQLYSTLSNYEGGKSCCEKDLEQSLNGNICRCTGYRPIMECAKSFAKDTKVKNQIDPTCTVGPYDAKGRDPTIVFPPEESKLEGRLWSRASSLGELVKAVAEGATPIAGNTASGIYPDLGIAPDALAAGRRLVDVSEVAELRSCALNGTTVAIGAAVTWSGFVEFLDATLKGSANIQNKAALTAVRDRCESIAGGQVRNLGTLGGNIAIARSKGFLSDWVPVLTALGASIEVQAKGAGSSQKTDLLDFVRQAGPFDGLILAVSLPLPSADVVFRSYRVSRRGHMAHAFVNGGFAVKVSGGRVSEARIVVGGADAKHVRMQGLEAALNGVQAQEVKADIAAVAERVAGKALQDLSGFACTYGRAATERAVCGFAVKFLSAAFGADVPVTWRSADGCLHDAERATSATQAFPVPENVPGPLNQPMTKTNAADQVNGAAKYVDDFGLTADGLVAALVLCPEANVAVSSVSADKAKAVLGEDFHALFTAEDIKNNSLSMCKVLGMEFKPDYKSDYQVAQDLLLPLNAPSRFAGQAVAVLLVKGKEHRKAEYCADLLSKSIEFKRVGPVELGNLTEGEELTVEPFAFTKGKGSAAEVVAKAKAEGGKSYLCGRVNKQSQAHFPMESQSVTAEPFEGGLLIHAANQSNDALQKAVCAATGLAQSQVTIRHRRVGGGFGGKMTAPCRLAALAGQLALKAKRPIRLVLPKETETTLVGGRQELESKWEAAVDPATGEIKAVTFEVWLAHGAGGDMQKFVPHAMGATMDEVYAIPSMSVAVHLIKQHLPCRTAVRGPGHFEAHLLTEGMIDGIACQLGLPGPDVRERNLAKGRKNTSGLAGGLIPQAGLEDYSTPAMWALLKQKIGYEKREQAVREFNTANMWKKRGLALSPARYGMMLTPGHVARVDVFKDGSLQIATDGSEIGQGLHTKVAQSVSTMFARELGHGPPLSVISFLNTSTEQNPNGTITGGSTTSEACMFAAMDAAKQLSERLRKAAKTAAALPKDKKSEEGPWHDILKCAFENKFMGVLVVPPNLSAVGIHMTIMSDIMSETYGVGASEVELDVLTGETKVLFSSLLFDVGSSYNPMIDIGQMEGAFMMGMGQCTTEGIEFDPATGKNLSPNTWDYKPPLASDVPERFEVELVDMRGQRLNNIMAEYAKGAVFGILGCMGVPWSSTPTPKVFRSAKAIGEPPLMLATSVQSAIHSAVAAATGGTIPENCLPMPPQPFALLPLLSPPGIKA